MTYMAFCFSMCEVSHISVLVLALLLGLSRLHKCVANVTFAQWCYVPTVKMTIFIASYLFVYSRLRETMLAYAGTDV